MRLTVICGLDHVPEECKAFEAARLLNELAEQIRTEGVKTGDMRIMNAPNGTRVGVSDITEH